MSDKVLTVYIFVDVLDTFDAACCLHVEVTFVFTEQIWVIGYNPSTVNIIVEFIVSFDGCEYRSCFWTLVLWIAISLYLCLLTLWKGKAFTTFAS